MELRTVVNDPKVGVGFSELITAINEIRDIVLKHVLETYLRVKAESFGPAEFYVRKCGFVDDRTQGLMCVVRLTGVPVTDNCSNNDFWKACQELKQIFKKLIKKHIRSPQKVQLCVSVVLNQPLPGIHPSTTIVETKTEWIKGEK